MENKIKVAELDFTQSTNPHVKAQGIPTCVYTGGKGWFCAALPRYPTRQDLAVILNERTIGLENGII